jgi:hypothetical protein
MINTKDIRKHIRWSETHNKGSVLDMIKRLTGLTSGNASTVFERIKKDHPGTNFDTFKFPGQGQRPTPIADYDTLLFIAKLVLSSSRQSLDSKRLLLAQLGADDAMNWHPVRSYIEPETLQPIMKVFQKHAVIQQCSVGPYFIDLYFVNEKIAVECDEEGHRWKRDSDAIRQQFIEQQLGCRFIRYEPHSPGFDILDIIKLIHEAIIITSSG